MALVGFVITRNLECNHIYAGVPATDVTSKLGTQFEETGIDKRNSQMLYYLEEFYEVHPEQKEAIAVVDNINDQNQIQFDIERMMYTKRYKRPKQPL